MNNTHMWIKNKRGGIRFQNGKMVRWSIPSRATVPQHPSWRSLQLPKGRVRHSVTRACPSFHRAVHGFRVQAGHPTRGRGLYPRKPASTPSSPCLGYRWPLHHPAACSPLNQALYTCSTSLLQPIWDLSGLLTPKWGNYRIQDCTSLSFKYKKPWISMQSTCYFFNWYDIGISLL